MLLNLVLNACKPTNANDVNERHLTVTTEDDGFVQIDVSDRGVGLPDDQQAAIRLRSR